VNDNLNGPAVVMKEVQIPPDADVPVIREAVRQLELRSRENTAALNEGRGIVLPLVGQVSGLHSELADFRTETRSGLSELRGMLESRRDLFSHACELTVDVAKGTGSALVSVAGTLADNERAQLKWVAVIMISLAAIAWSATVAMGPGGITIGG